MTNCPGRFRIVILAAVFILACTKSDGEVSLVRPELLDARECWFDRQGKLAAFLVLARRGRIGVPYLVSAKCIVNGGYTSYGEGIILHLGAVHIDDASGSLQRALPDVIISDSIRTDQPLPSSDSRVYYFQAYVTPVSDSSMSIYAIDRVVELTDTNISFERFLGLTKVDRERLLRNYN